MKVATTADMTVERLADLKVGLRVDPWAVKKVVRKAVKKAEWLVGCSVASLEDAKVS